MKPTQAYLLGGLIFVICVAIGVYYLIPGPVKVLVSDDPTGQHVKHALAFFAVSIVALVGARFVANSQTAH